MSKELFIFAGELSADLHGEKLILSLLKQDPTLKIWGVGGPKMRHVGMDCILPMEAFQVMGFIDVLGALPKLIKHFFFLKKTILKRQPSAAIFIDYADFNMRLEASLKKAGYQGKLIHYISPSVWAWRKNRIKTLAHSLDLLLVIYPFEEECYAGSPLKVRYVGHPLIARLKEHVYREDVFPNDQTCIALFPGSRKKELLRNLPLMLQTIKKLTDPSLHFALSLSHTRFKSLVEEIIQKEDLKIPLRLVPSEYNYELMKSAHLALAKSGTVTLELALHEVPTVVIYKISLLDEWIGKYLFRILLPYYCIVNILLKKRAFPEFIRHQINEDEVASELQHMFAQPEECKQQCRLLKNLLTDKDANVEAAKAILETI